MDYFDNVTAWANETDDAMPRVHITKGALAITSCIFILIFVVGLVCNALVIATICRTRTLRTSSINRAVLSLCFADLITSVLDVPFTFLILLGNYFDFMVSYEKNRV